MENYDVDDAKYAIAQDTLYSSVSPQLHKYLQFASCVRVYSNIVRATIFEN